MVEDIGNKRASLLACGSEDCEELAHDGLNEFACWGEGLKRRLKEIPPLLTLYTRVFFSVDYVTSLMLIDVLNFLQFQ
jgi:hypothetical protein